KATPAPSSTGARTSARRATPAIPSACGSAAGWTVTTRCRIAGRKTTNPCSNRRKTDPATGSEHARPAQAGLVVTAYSLAPLFLAVYAKEKRLCWRKPHPAAGDINEYKNFSGDPDSVGGCGSPGAHSKPCRQHRLRHRSDVLWSRRQDRRHHRSRPYTGRDRRDRKST